MKRAYFELQPCLCLCGEICGWHWFKRGHATTALASIVHDHYESSARRFIRENGGEINGGHAWPAAFRFAKEQYGSIAEAVLAHRRN